MESRRNAKIEINLACRLTSPRLGNEFLTGITENISRGDIVVLLEEAPAAVELPGIGDPIVVEIDLPANHAFGRKCMQCQTTVARVVMGEAGPPRIAMRIHKMRFQSRGEGRVFGDKPGELVRQLLM
jgi:hypothetical protein